MQIFLLLGHPNPDSFNHAIATFCTEQLQSLGHSVILHDLYAENFNPVHYPNSPEKNKDALKRIHRNDLVNSDAIIVIHPNWWGQPPAIIKGWVDSILLPGIAYELEQNTLGNYVPKGILTETKALIITTANTPDNFENDVLDTIWKDNIFGICGVKAVDRVNFGTISQSSRKERNAWIKDLMQKLNEFFPVSN